MSRRTLAVGVVLLALVGGGIWLLSGGSAPGATPSPSATLPPIAASTTVSADARVVPARRAELDPPGAGGVVAEVSVAEGGEVAAGAPLLRLDAAVADAEVASAEAAVAAATANAEQARAAAEQAEAGVEAAIAAAEGARAGLTAADAQRDGLPSGASSSQERAADAEVDRARAALDAARAERSSARAARTAARAAASAAEAEVARAEAGLAAAVAARDRLTLTAPFAGTVASVDADVGDTVEPGTPVVRLAGPGGWRFETTDLDEATVGRIAEGASATVSLDAFPDAPIEARVVSISPFGELSAGDVVYTVILEPTGSLPDGLRWNMTASATIDTIPAS
jgi:multidrug resistance efflux pump